MGVYGRDLGHVSDDVAKVLDEFGEPGKAGSWAAYDPDEQGEGAARRDQDRAQRRVPPHEGHVQQPGRRALVLASLLIYFLMVGLDRSFLVPLSVMLIVPLCLVGHHADALPHGLGGQRPVAPGLHLHRRHQGGQLGADDRLRPGTAAARGPVADRGHPQGGGLAGAADHDDGPGGLLRADPGAFALERGSEANAPLARAILGGLLAGEPATLFVLPRSTRCSSRIRPETEEERKRTAGRPPPRRRSRACRIRRRRRNGIDGDQPRGTRFGPS